MVYSIVQFVDGILAVPSKWINKDKKQCRYPSDDKSVKNAIRTLKDVERDWLTYKILRIFGTAGKVNTHNDNFC